jgi:chemotaxis protein CheX
MNPMNPKPTFDNLTFRVAETTFGELAFVLVIPEEAEPIDAKTPTWQYVCRVEFTGPFAGELFVGITADMLRPLVTNMLGLDASEEIPPDVPLGDALKELANVVCGNLLPAISGDEVVFKISGPEILPVAEIPRCVPKRYLAGQTELFLELGTAGLRLFIDKDAEVPSPPESVWSSEN